MNAGLDFALAQVRDRDLVIESLREQHKTLGDHAANMERLLEAAEAKLAEAEEDAEEARKVRGALSLAAPAGYAVAHIKQLQADLENANEHADNAERAIKELEAKLAEVERILNKSVTSRKATEKRLAEVEKERDKTEEYAKEGWDWLSEALDALGAKTVFDIKARAAAMDRARERLQDIADATDDQSAWAVRAREIARDVARLLSGDE